MAEDPVRRRRLADALAGAGLDALICASPTQILLLSGYWPVMGASVAVFARDGDVRVIVPEDEMEIASKTSAAKLVPYKPARLDELITPIEALAQPLGSVLREMKLTNATVGADAREEMQPSTYAASLRFNCAIIELVSSVAPQVKLADNKDLVEGEKAAKTPIELELIRQSVRIAASGFNRAPACLQPGMRENDVAAALQQAFETTDQAKDTHRFYGYFYCMSGPNSAEASGAFARTRQRTILDGDLVLLHANTCADGYWTDITRTFVVGEANEKQRAMRAAIDDALIAARRAIRPGAFARDVDAAARNVMEQHGMGNAFRHSTGHGVGFAAANPNGLPRIHPKSPDVLEEGMTFNVEPAAYFDGFGGMRHCDVVAVSSTGVDVLTEF
ncbi:MAG: M24 family metallopeptidase [Acidobacteriota bacterium]